ncbi:VOC family protein [Ponticaulis sp.]|uniref:VOC family protein n=1 Tax=Ponticaulis sp. TaxID=2020902 RepID=UPI000B653F42|nr:VOC family protein [Ponticaulis sp.]MAI90604.1 hypothetical protein [Ponticaulis sp.]OUX99117.1 MAG: hypothetical protein CBB65_09205 [Hyphomonadaceae bacterium TMED5]|tara:strand:- start:99535 stop:100014 length:480 start_codon:yes stop_codon:yes gene_type:complete
MKYKIKTGLLAAAFAFSAPFMAQGDDMTDAEQAVPVAVSAIGIGVTSLETSSAFYEGVLSMRPVATFSLDYMDEIVLVAPNGGSAIVLMEYTDGIERNVTNLPVKIVLRVEDPTALAADIREAGYEIVREPVPSEEVGGAIVGFARDPDGYLIEILPVS